MYRTLIHIDKMNARPAVKNPNIPAGNRASQCVVITQVGGQDYSGNANNHSLCLLL